MAYHFSGKAIFSTHNGLYARREKIPSIRTILRSNPIEDRDTMVAKLQEEFPEACKAITAPVTDSAVYEYFDYCDAAVQGFEFLRAVLAYIAGLNARADAQKSIKIRNYVGRWKNTNTEAFNCTRIYHAVADLFTEEDIEEHGLEFLTEAMVEIKRLRAQREDNEARQSAVRLEMQRAQIMQNQRSFTQSQASARSPFPIVLSPAQIIRASSNPEHTQPHPPGGLTRHLPGPTGQFPTSQSHFPLQRLTPSTEVLEHIHPGSTSRGDFHSDPTAQNAMDTCNCGPPNEYVAIPSRGLPGPFSYQTLPPPPRSVPLLNRRGTFNGNAPRGKKNPKKRSSDDARMVSSPGNGPRQANNNTNPQQSPRLQYTQMPFNPRSSPLIQQVHPSKAVSYIGHYHDLGLPPSQDIGNRRDSFYHTPNQRFFPIQPTIEGHSRGRAVSNPFSPFALDLHAPVQDPRPTIPSLSISTNRHHQTALANEQPFGENSGSVSTRLRPQIHQPSDPHTFGLQLPGHHTDAQYQMDPASESRRPALASVSNSGQSQFPGKPWRSRANEIPQRSVQEGCTIWIGGIPKEFDRAALMDLLRPCRGFVEVNGPRQSSPPKARNSSSYAFADFQNPADAAEAIERLPQTRFTSLPEGTFLSTNWAKSKVYSSPSQREHEGDEAPKRLVSSTSPTKFRKSENSGHAGKTKMEHGRKPSKGSARGNIQPANTSERKLGKSSERVSAMDADKMGSGLHPEAKIISTSYDGTAGPTACVSQLSTKASDPMSLHQNPGAIQPDVGVYPHKTQVSGNAVDGVQIFSSAPNGKLQVQERSSRHTQGRTKASKKKSQGSNKLSVPEDEGWGPRTVHAASDNDKPEARAQPAMNETVTSLEDFNHMIEKGIQATFEAGGNKTGDPIVPLEPTSTSRYLNTADQSFLGTKPTEFNNGELKAPIATAFEVTGAEDDEKDVSETAPAPFTAVPLELSQEPTSQAMRRDVSNSSHGSVDSTSSLLSHTCPPSSSQTERSGSMSHGQSSPKFQAPLPLLGTTVLPLSPKPCQQIDNVEAKTVGLSASRSGSAVTSERAFEQCAQPQEARSDAEILIRNPGLGETAMETTSNFQTSLIPSEIAKGTEHVGELAKTTKTDTNAWLIGENFEQSPSILSIQSSQSKSDQATSKTPARKRTLSIPPRSSSLAAPPTAIKTHKKKKPRQLTPVKEASPSGIGDLPLDGPRMDLSPQPTKSSKLSFPTLPKDLAAHTLMTDKLNDLPKPETPFLMDDGVRVTPPKINRQIVEASNADRYYAQKTGTHVFHWSSASQIDTTFCSHDSPNSASTHPSEKSASDSTLEGEDNDLETTLREAGYRSLSDTSPFTIKDRDLMFFETIDEEGKPLDNRSDKDRPVLTWLDEKGKIGQVLSLDAWRKQHEMIEVVKKATAVKRHLADSALLPWTNIESLRQKLLRFVNQNFSDAHEQLATDPKAPKIRKAEGLLNKIPQRKASISEMQKWSRKVSLLLKESASEPTTADIEAPKPVTNNLRKSSRGTSSRTQRQERLHPVLINQPHRQSSTQKPVGDEDGFPTGSTELNDSLTSGQTTESEPSPSTCGHRTPSEEDSTPSVAIIPSWTINEVTKLKALFDMREACRRWSDDHHGSSTPQDEEHMTASVPELRSLAGELDEHRMSEIEDVKPEQGLKKTENQMQQKPHVDEPDETKEKDLDSDDGKQVQILTTKSDESKDPTSTELTEETVQKAEDPACPKQISQPLSVSFSSFENNHTNGNEPVSDEVQQNRPRSGHNPPKRSGYNAVAGRGIDEKRGGAKGASKDPWALPQGEKPWGSGGEGRGGKKRRGG